MQIANFNVEPVSRERQLWLSHRGVPQPSQSLTRVRVIGCIISCSFTRLRVAFRVFELIICMVFTAHVGNANCYLPPVSVKVCRRPPLIE